MLANAGLVLVPKQLSWEDLQKLSTKGILTLANGNTVVFCGMETEANPQGIRILDPKHDGDEMLFVDKATLLANWTGQLLILEPIQDHGAHHQAAFTDLIKCLSMIRKHHGVAGPYDEAAIRSRFDPKRRADAEDVAAMAEAFGLRTLPRSISPADLETASEGFPLLVDRPTGPMVVCGVVARDDDKKLVVVDPASGSLEQIEIAPAALGDVTPLPAFSFKPVIIRDSALECLVAIARGHGIELSVENIRRRYALSGPVKSATELLRIIIESGFSTLQKRQDWMALAAAADAFPILALRRDGTAAILEKYFADKDVIEAADPLRDAQGVPTILDAQTYARDFSGEVVFLKPKPAAADGAFGIASFFKEILRLKVNFFDIGMATLFLQVISLATPLFFQIVIDKVLVHRTVTTLHVLGIGMVVAICFDCLITYIRNYLLLDSTSVIDVRLAFGTFDKLMSLPIRFFEHKPSGVLIQHMRQPEKIREFVSGKLFMTLLESVSLVVYLPILYCYSAKLATLVLVFSLLIAMTVLLALRPFRVKLQDLYMAEGERQAYLVETIQGIDTVKALTLEGQRQRGWDNRCAVTTGMRFRVRGMSTSIQALIDFLQKFTVLAIPWFGAQLVFDNQMSVGALVAFQMLAGRISGPLVRLVSLVQDYQEAGLALRMLGGIMNEESEARLDTPGLRPQVHGRIEFRDVNFRYAPDMPPALSDISFVVEPGEIIGIVGQSGSGKSTLTRLMQGMYPVQEGDVRIDDSYIKDIDLGWLRQSIGVVLQDNRIFRATVRKNIAMAKPDATLDEVVQAANLAAAHEFIEKLPQGYNTFLDENGSNLSGGQKQRLAIARALLRDPKIFILDEATSALDSESEARIQANLSRIAKSRTMIIVSHRLSLIAKADRILVLDSGKIAAMGDHKSLYDSCQIYKNLWDAQHAHLLPQAA
jgi:ATP-binding cassette subfamily B protein